MERKGKAAAVTSKQTAVKGDGPRRRPIDTTMTKQPLSPESPGFGRDRELERERSASRPAKADLSATEAKATRQPTLDYAPDPAEEVESGNGGDRA